MAGAIQAFSPKEWKVAVVSDATNAGDTGIGTTMNQLDVDSISMPSLNPTQVLDVRSGVGRTLKDEDVFQDNVLRVSEISLSGTLHNDTGHKLLLQNICNDVSGDVAVSSNFTPASQNMVGDTAVTNAASSLTLVFQPSDVTNQQGMEFFGCVVTNFSISADMTSEGGRYKWSATIQTGLKPDLASTATPTITAYANTNIPLLSNASDVRISDVSNMVLNSFTASIESPAVFSGAWTGGYEITSRGAEIAVNVDAQVKYDANTKGFISEFDTQTAANTAGNMFKIVNNNAYGILVTSGLFTNVALSEGDIMMLDCSIKAIDDGSSDLISFDLTA
tara:strand:- start:1678 stop:2679 length:1002 start_codon:yes stop_codon:yes gene_type:complete